MHAIKLTQPGFAGYEGDLYGIPFSDGVSQRPVTKFEVARLGASMLVVAIDADGNELGQVGPHSDLLNRYKAEATPFVFEPSLKLQIHEDQAAASPAAPVSDKKIYTEEELAQIADSEGIAGLRRIAPNTVRGTSISKLIQGILDAQVPA